MLRVITIFLMSLITCSGATKPQTNTPAGPASQRDSTGDNAPGLVAAADGTKGSVPDPAGEEQAEKQKRLNRNLCSSAHRGNPSKVRALLDQGADANSADTGGFTALMCSAQDGHFAIVKLLLDRGADVNRANIHGDRAINFAQPHPKIVKLLVAHGSVSADFAYRQRAVAALRREFSDVAGDYSDEQLANLVGQSVETAERMGISYERRIFYYVLARLVFRADVGVLPQYRWIQRTLLRKKETLRNQRFNAFRKQLRRRKLTNAWQLFGRPYSLTLRDRFLDAAKRNQPDQIKEILAKGYDATNGKHRREAIEIATSAGHVETVAALLEAGVAVNGESLLLHSAAGNGRFAVVKLLLDRGADVNRRSGRGETALDLAEDNNYSMIFALLQSRGGKSGKQGMLTGGFGERGASDRSKSKSRKLDALLAAADNGNVREMKRILASGGRINARNSANETALVRAVEAGHVEATRFLLGRGARVNLRGFQTPLHAAALRNDITVMKLLISHGADVNRGRGRKRNASTPLMLAASNGHLEAAKLLIDSGANVNTRTKDGHTALIFASRDGRLRVVKLLVAHGAQTGFIDYDGKNAIEHARDSGYRAILDVLAQGQR